MNDQSEDTQATCRTCGGSGTIHYPTVLDPHGIGHPDHKHHVWLSHHPEPPQDTSLDVHMTMLAKSESAKDCGELTVVPLGFAVSIAKELLANQRAKLFEQIRSEVIKDDEVDQTEPGEKINKVEYLKWIAVRNNLRITQREALTRLEGKDE